MDTDMMRADRNMPRLVCKLLRDAKRATPIERLHTPVGPAPRARKILASGNSRHLQRRRMAEDFFLRTLRRHASVRQHNEFFANTIRLFKIVAHEQCRSGVTRQRFAQLALQGATEMC